MKKTILTITVIILLLLVTSLASNGIKQPTTNETKESKSVNVEAEVQTNHLTDDHNVVEEDSQKTTSTNEDTQTLENSSQNKDATPPNGRVYYPTSSEEPYAYIPTYTPKEAKMPIKPPTETEN